MECKCKRCGYEWKSNKRTGKPRLCASCKSKYWDSDLAVKSGPVKKYEETDRLNR